MAMVVDSSGRVGYEIEDGLRRAEGYGMILRVFRAIIHDGMQDKFQKFFLGKALPNVRSQAGLISATVGLPRKESPNKFSMVMVWRDVEALKGFAGENWRQAVIDPDEVHLLKTTYLHHFDLAEV